MKGLAEVLRSLILQCLLLHLLPTWDFLQDTGLGGQDWVCRPRALAPKSGSEILDF